MSFAFSGFPCDFVTNEQRRGMDNEADELTDDDEYDAPIFLSTRLNKKNTPHI